MNLSRKLELISNFEESIKFSENWINESKLMDIYTNNSNKFFDLFYYVKDNTAKCMPNSLREKIIKIIIEDMKEISKRALQLMHEEKIKMLLDCKDELEELEKQIKDIKNGSK